MLRGVCPDECCGRPLLLTASATCASCPSCHRRPITIDQLRDVEESNNSEDHVNWLYWKAAYEEKNGKLSTGRLRVVHRMIDGLVDLFHTTLLWGYFERYGLDKEGEAKKLAEMRRMEPINVSTFGNYAFAIQKEHIDVWGYGRDYSASRYLAKMIVTVASVNGLKPTDRTVLVPLLTCRPDACNCISRAITGREIFSRRLREAVFYHLKYYAAHYKKLSDYADVFSSILSAETLDPLYIFPFDLELAALSNVLFRPILLLDAEPPFVKQVFLPRFCKPEDCRNRSGTKRPPLLVAWADRMYCNMVALVSVATENKINPVYLPRDWLKSVWGTADHSMTEEMLKLYIGFAENDRCLVAHGIYFKPQFLRRLVNAMNTKALNEKGVHPRVVSNYLSDLMPPAYGDPYTAVMDIGSRGELWRCTICESLVWNSSTPMEPCPICGVHGMQRVQFLDGTVGYLDGDHTETAAPNSWCFTKRKHYHGGIEYDNPPLSIQLTTVHQTISWFRGESDTRLNSRLEDVVGQLVRRYYSTRGTDIADLSDSIKQEITSKLNNKGYTQQQLANHLEDTLGEQGMQNLFDDLLNAPMGQENAQRNERKEQIKIPDQPISIKKSPPREETRVKTDASKADRLAKIEEVCVSLHSSARDYKKRTTKLKKMMAEKGETEELKGQMKEANDMYKCAEEAAIKSLTDAMAGCPQQDRWRLICSTTYMNRLGDLFFHYAQHSGYRIGEHFSIPLLGDLKFSFADDGGSLVACLPGGHFPPHESVDLICAMYSDDPQIFASLGCDHASG